MIQYEPVIRTMKISAVRSHLNDLVNGVSRKELRILGEKSGMPIAAIVSTEDLERLDRLDRERAERFAVIDEVREAFKDVPDEEIERETVRILAGIREEDRKRAAIVDRQR